jgi:hypothetical protein
MKMVCGNSIIEWLCLLVKLVTKFWRKLTTHLTADISANTKFCIRLIKTFGGPVGGRMLKVMCSVALIVTRLRRLRKQGYCNHFWYRALSGKV